MEKGSELGSANAAQYIRVTPEQLRAIANKMELMSHRTFPGHSITYQLSPKLTFFYEPAVSVEKFATNLVKSLESDETYPLIQEDDNGNDNRKTDNA